MVGRLKLYLIVAQRIPDRFIHHRDEFRADSRRNNRRVKLTQPESLNNAMF